jgi:hypothetical protein
VHLVGFTIEIYHAARFHERQMCHWIITRVMVDYYTCNAVDLVYIAPKLSNALPSVHFPSLNDVL